MFPALVVMLLLALSACGPKALPPGTEEGAPSAEAPAAPSSAPASPEARSIDQTLTQSCPDVALSPLAELARDHPEASAGNATLGLPTDLEANGPAGLFLQVNLAPLADLEALARPDETGGSGGLDQAFAGAAPDVPAAASGKPGKPRKASRRPDLNGTGFVPVSEGEGLALTEGLNPKAQGLRSWTDLRAPLERSLSFLSGRPRDRYAVVRPDLTLTWGQLETSLRQLLALLPRLDQDPGLLARHFVWYRYEPGATMTAYYAPVVEASLTPRAGYPYPLYAPPPDLVRLNLGRFSGSLKNQWITARDENGRVRPYHSRRDIDGNQALAGRGLEIAWLKSPLDAFYLHVQGGGKLKLPDGSIQGVAYAGDNGRSFTGLGAILLREGRLRPDKANMDAVRAYFAEHPRELRPAMFQNERYIFFRLTGEGHSGAMGKPLTPMLSMATDPSLLPPGCVFAMQTGLPGDAGGQARAVSGLGLAQDKGAAIKGRRLDYYVGEGQKAGAVAQNIHATTAIHLLVSREALLQ